jgi:hypothetical protein
MIQAADVFPSTCLGLVSVLVSIRMRRLPQVRADLGGHASQHVAGDVLVSLRESRIGPTHDLHRGPVGYAELQEHRRGSVAGVV